ncbi:protein of unknown function [Microbacterium sp. Nx66]|nr:protein of unknown function [Microbacterium sp. Nx66]
MRFSSCQRFLTREYVRIAPVSRIFYTRIPSLRSLFRDHNRTPEPPLPPVSDPACPAQPEAGSKTHLPGAGKAPFRARTALAPAPAPAPERAGVR